MDVYNLMNDLVQAVAADGELRAWCLAKYGQEPKVFIDQDDRLPPDGETQAPDVQFHTPSKSADEERRIVDYGFGLFVVIYNATAQNRPESNVSGFSASQDLMTLINRVLTVVRAAKPEYWVMRYSVMPDTISEFPNFVADVSVEFTHRLVIGDDPLND